MFLKIVFYLFGIFPILWEGYSLFNPRQTKNFVDTLLATKTEDRTDIQKTYSFLTFGYFIWIAIGMMTALNWPLFMVIILLGFIPKNYLIIRMLDSFISLSLIIFAFVNAFHLHIDVFHWLINL